MELMKSKYIKTTISEYLNENNQLVNKILDKISVHGEHSLSYDERKYLKQYSEDNIDKELENWLLDDDDFGDTFYDGEKILFDEFSDDEYILGNREKLIRIISKHLNKEPFTNNADWGGGDVWSLDSDDGITGTFLYLGDDDLVVLKRTIDDEENYEDDIIQYIETGKDFYKFLLQLNK